MTVVRLALVQMQPAEEPEKNVEAALNRIEEACEAGAQVVCLPELFAAHYPCQTEDARRFDLAEPIPGPTSQRIAAAAKRHGVVVVASLFERRAAGLYHNTAVTFDADGSQVGLYRKMHIPDDPLYYEKFYFTPGDLGFRSAPTQFGNVGTLVCWDQWFPEAARLTATAGAQMLVYPTAIGWQFNEGADVDAAQHDAWETIQRSHAIANGVFVAAINRVGPEGEIRFWGQSFVADPSGRVIARASSTKPELLLVDCDLAQIEEVRRGWPFLRDRRVDAYGDLTRLLRD